MRVVVADRAIHLRQHLDARDPFDRTAEARRDVRELLADRRRARGLAVRARHHRDVGVSMREVDEPPADRGERRQQHVVARGLDHQAVRRVVDVFRRAGEVDELACAGEFGGDVRGRRREALLQPVLDGLHVVVRDGLDGLDACGIIGREAGFERLDPGTRRGRERTQLGEACIRQCDEPRQLDPHPMLHEAGFGQQRTQAVDLRRVASVERRQGIEGRERCGHRTRGAGGIGVHRRAGRRQKGAARAPSGAAREAVESSIASMRNARAIRLLDPSEPVKQACSMLYFGG